MACRIELLPEVLHCRLIAFCRKLNISNQFLSESFDDAKEEKKGGFLKPRRTVLILFSRAMRSQEKYLK